MNLSFRVDFLIIEMNDSPNVMIVKKLINITGLDVIRRAIFVYYNYNKLHFFFSNKDQRTHKINIVIGKMNTDILFIRIRTYNKKIKWSIRPR